MRNLLPILFLLLFFFGIVNGQDSKSREKLQSKKASVSADRSPTPPIRINPAPIDALGDTLLTFNVSNITPTPDITCLGVEFAEGHFWVTGRDPNDSEIHKLYKINPIGPTLINFWQQGTTSIWGWRDLAYDGTFLYTSDSQDIVQIDPSTGQPTSTTIPGPENPNRALAYDPATDHFWTINFSSDIYEFDRNGNIINQFPNSLSAYGAAWDQWSSGGPYLWVWSQDGPTGGPLCTATQIDPSTGMPTGVNFVGVEMNVDPADDDIAGGASISIVTIDSQTHLVFIGLHQSNYLAPGDGLDWIVVYDISVPPVTPNLVSPQDGEVDVQTAPTTLSWQASPTANSYQLQVALSSNFSTSTIAVDQSGITNTTYSINRLAENSTYYWRLNATNSAGTSNWSNTQSFTTESMVQLNESFSFQNKNPGEYNPTEYRIIGLPGASDFDVKSILSGDQSTNWEVYFDNGAASTDPNDYLVKYDGTSTFRFSVGKAFWVIHQGNVSINEVVDAASLNSSGVVNIPLHQGWNLITNPFAIPVNWAVIQGANQIGNPIYRYNGSGGFSESGQMDPFIGYYFDNNTGLSGLEIPFPHGSSQPNKKLDPAIWRVRIELSSGEFIDNTSSFGIANKAKMGRDELDYRKPRGIVQTPSLAFNRPEWDNNYSVFATDIRREISGVEKWDFEVNSPTKEPTQLKFTGIENIPAQFGVYLVNQNGAETVNLREYPVYNFKPRTNISRFTVLVGNQNEIEEKIRSFLPKTFALQKNYPNPFNPTTIIPFSIPKKSYVELTVFNITGQRVKNVYSGILDVGHHEFEWDGRNNQGQKSASGLYLYRLYIADGQTFVGKMMLMK